MKKIISILCAVVMLTAIFALPASADSMWTWFNDDHSPVNGKLMAFETVIEPNEEVTKQFYLVDDADRWIVFYTITATLEGVTITFNPGSGYDKTTRTVSLPAGVRYHIADMFDCSDGYVYKLWNSVYINGKLQKKYETDRGGATGTRNWMRCDDTFSYLGTVELGGDTADNVIASYMKDYAAEMTGSTDCIVTPAENIYSSENAINILGTKTLADVTDEVTLSEGAALSATRGGETLSGNVELTAGDRLVVTSKNGKVINYYTVSVTVPEISSAVYDVNIGSKTIAGVLRYTTPEKFLSNLTFADGTEVDGIYNGDVKLTSGTISTGNTLKLASGSSYAISCINDVVSGTGGYIRCYLKTNTGHALQWQDNEPSGTYSKLAIEACVPKTISTTWQIRPIISGSGDGNTFMQCSAGSYYFANSTAKNRKDEVMALAEGSDNVNVKMIVDLSNASLTVYINDKFLDVYTSGIFKNAFLPKQNNYEGYSEIYLTTSGGGSTTLKSYFIDSVAEFEKATDTAYDKITFTEKDGSVTASVKPLSYNDGMLILGAYNDAGTRLTVVSVVDVTASRQAFAATLSADKVTNNVKAMYWSNDNVPRFAADYK